MDRALAIPYVPAPARQRPLPLGLVRSAGFWLAVVTLAGLGLRLAWTQTHDFFPLGGDGRWYLVVATNVAEGRGYVIDFDEHGREVVGEGEPTAFWPPGYPLALAGAIKLFGPGMQTAGLLNAAAEAATIVLIFLLGRSIAGTRAGLLAAGIYALLPEPVLSSEFAMAELPFTTLFLAALLVLVAACGPRLRPFAPLAFGLLAGLAILTRGEGLVLLPAALLFWLLRDGRGPALRSGALAVVTIALVLAPWTVRNAVVMRDFVPVSTNIGFNLRVGHSPDATGRYFWPEPIEETDSWNTLYHAMQPDEEATRSAIYTGRAFDYAWRHPADELVLAGKKLSWLFRVDPEADLVSGLSTLGATPIQPQALAGAVPLLVSTSHYGLLLLAALALPFWLRRREPKTLLLVSAVALWALFHVAFFSQPRYHLSLLPLLSIAAAWSFVQLLTMRARPPAGAAS